MHNNVELDKRDLSKVQVNEQEKLATEFSEGSENMKNLLLFLWDNGINTFACCGGHDEIEVEVDEDGSKFYDDNRPYVTFDMKALSDSRFKNILRGLCKIPEVAELSVINDHYERYGLDPRKQMVLVFAEPASTTENVIRLFYDVLHTDKQIDASHLSEPDKDFIDFAVLLKNVAVDDIDLTDYKKYYKNFNSKVCCIELQREPDYASCRVELNDNSVNVFTSEGPSYICDSAYFDAEEGCYIMRDAQTMEVISREEIEQRGLISVKSYDDLKYELFHKDVETFKKFLNSRPSLEKQMQ